MVHTDIARHVPYATFLYYALWPVCWLLMKSPYEGCQTVLYCAVSEELQGVSGCFYDDCAEKGWSKVSLDDSTAAKLWNVSEALTGIKVTYVKSE